MPEIIRDFNMMTGRVMAVSMFSLTSRPQGFPTSIQDVQQRAKLVDDIDKTMSKHFSSFSLSPLYKEQICSLSQSLFDTMMKEVTRIAKEQIIEVDDTNARNGVALSIWSGCMSAAKEIASGTRAGANTPQTREYSFTYIINPLCEIDELYKAGVEAAPIFKRLREDEISFDGVPPESPVRKYKDRTSTTN